LAVISSDFTFDAVFISQVEKIYCIYVIASRKKSTKIVNLLKEKKNKNKAEQYDETDYGYMDIDDSDVEYPVADYSTDYALEDMEDYEGSIEGFNITMFEESDAVRRVQAAVM
jgi:hypothetical protein